MILSYWSRADGGGTTHAGVTKSLSAGTKTTRKMPM
jgi:hypothetical protein